MKKSLIAASAVLCFATAAFAQSDGTIGIYTDAVGSSCCFTIPPFTQGVAHVVATLAGASGGGTGIRPGITGAEFRIEIPNQSGYFLNWQANPASNVGVGNPLDTTPADPNDPYGIIMGFPSCQGMMLGDKVSLGTITIFNTGGQPTPMRVKRRQPPSNPTLRDCPVLVLCDSPDFTQVCLSPQAAGEPEEPIHFAAQLNMANCTDPSMMDPGTCGTVAVAPSNWSAVKSLFR